MNLSINFFVTINTTSQIKNCQIGLILDNCDFYSAKTTIRTLKNNDVNVYFISPNNLKLALVEKYLSILSNLVQEKLFLTL